MNGVCSVCGRDGRIRVGLCDAHYFRMRRTGSAGPAQVRAYQPGATCSVADCDQPLNSSGYCRMHYTRHLRHGDASVVKTPARRTGPANASWTGDLATYNAVHLRVRSALGRASGYPCSQCGAPAEEWAYDNKDANERIDDACGMRYSTDLSHYIPMCAQCHRRYDDNPIAKRRGVRIPCTIAECDRISKAKGLCSMHYLRARRARAAH